MIIAPCVALFPVAGKQASIVSIGYPQYVLLFPDTIWQNVLGSTDSGITDSSCNNRSVTL